LLRHRRCWDHIGLPRRRSMLANLLRDPQPGRAATGPPHSAPTSTHRSPPSVAGGSRRRGPRLYPRSICCCCVSFFSWSEIRFASPCRSSPHCRRRSQERGGCCMHSQAAASTLVIKPSSPVSPPFQEVVPSDAIPRQACTRFESAPTAIFAGTLPPMLLKEDARALFSCLVYHRHSPLTVLQLSPARTC